MTFAAAHAAPEFVRADARLERTGDREDGIAGDEGQIHAVTVAHGRRAHERSGEVCGRADRVQMGWGNPHDGADAVRAAEISPKRADIAGTHADRRRPDLPIVHPARGAGAPWWYLGPPRTQAPPESGGPGPAGQVGTPPATIGGPGGDPRCHLSMMPAHTGRPGFLYQVFNIPLLILG